MRSIIFLIMVLGSISYNYAQNPIDKYFKSALNKYTKIQHIDWIINEDNSVNICSKHLKIEAISKSNDTTYFVTFHVFPDSLNDWINMVEFATLIKSPPYNIYTSYDSLFIPKYKFKFKPKEPEILIFEFGKDIYEKTDIDPCRCCNLKRCV